ncbi:phage-like protein [Aurantimonas sp. 22II-16-19i]|nr:phage-like protein [Aurantimonas sp. 22II-16-19i]
MDYAEHQRQDARLVMLRALHEQPDDTLNETMLLTTLKAFGYRKTKEWVRTELRVMEDLGAVRLDRVGEFVIAKITEAGASHVERVTTIEGIARPSRR